MDNAIVSAITTDERAGSMPRDYGWALTLWRQGWVPLELHNLDIDVVGLFDLFQLRKRKRKSLSTMAVRERPMLCRCLITSIKLKASFTGTEGGGSVLPAHPAHTTSQDAQRE